MKNKDYNYRITLTPVDKFFFGGDMTFQVGNDEKDQFNRQYSSYIIQSSRFPQQTSLLGMLRFLILRNAGDDIFKDGCIVDNPTAKEAAAKLIGNKSFCVNNNHEKNEFGKIEHISHVRLMKGDVELEHAPLFGKIEFNNGSEGTYNFGPLKVPTLDKDHYDAKDGLEPLMMVADGFDDYFNRYHTITADRKEEKKKKEPKLPKPPYQLEDLFVEDRRIGIARSIKTGLTDDGALFKQISYRFKNKEADLCFVFDAKVEGVDLDKYNGQLVSVGGDNSQFIIGITTKNQTENTGDNALAISLLSPAFLTRDDVKRNTCYAVTQLMPFRFLTDKTDKTDNNDNDKRSYHILNSKLKRSKRYELYAPGSVFYFNDNKKREAFIEALTSKQDFRQIGYNEYKSIK